MEKPEQKDLVLTGGKEVSTQSSMPQTMESILKYAIDKGAGIDQIEKMMELQERYERNEAKKAYYVAMAAFKANPPKINKDATVDYTSQKGRTNYRHATLANVTEKISAALSKHGLSAAWETNQEGDKITVKCRITHLLGYSESTQLSANPDNSGNKNSIQAVGSTVTYLERYTILSLTGLATHEDDDGAGSENIYISEDQLSELNLLIEKKGIDLDLFLTYMEVERIDQIRKPNFKKAIRAVAIAKGKKTDKEEGEQK